VLGRALEGQRRDGLEIFTKVFWPTGPGPNDRGLSRKHILTSIEGSLRRLKTDYVDLYQAHRYDHTTPLSNQPQYNMIWRVIEAEVIPTCDELGMSQIVWSPIAQGVLTGKYKPGEQPPQGSRATDERGSGFIRDLLRDDVLKRVQQLQPIADELRLSMAQLAVAWVLQNDNVASAIVGASRPEQVIDNVKAAGVKLEAAVLKQIDDILGDKVERDPAKTRSPRSPR
jgi:aryl-alcohol dehydrogenase-like predicted oxidoreductase